MFLYDNKIPAIYWRTERESRLRENSGAFGPDFTVDYPVGKLRSRLYQGKRGFNFGAHQRVRGGEGGGGWGVRESSRGRLFARNQLRCRVGCAARPLCREKRVAGPVRSLSCEGFLQIGNHRLRPGKLLSRREGTRREGESEIELRGLRPESDGSARVSLSPGVPAAAHISTGTAMK